MNRSILFFLIIAAALHTTSPAQVWDQLGTPTGGSIDAMASVGRSIIALQTFGGVYRSDNNGESWQFVTDALSGTAVFDMAASPAGVLYVIGYQKLAISSDVGATWKTKRLQFVPTSIDFTANGDLLVGSPGRILRSSDEGENWTDIIPNPAVTYGYNVAVSAGGIWFAGGYRSGLYRSSDEGANWDRLDGSMTNMDVYSVTALAPSVVIVGLGNTAWRSSDDGLTWEHLTSLDSVNTFGIVAGNDGAFYASTTRGLAISTDQGRSWKKSSNQGRVFGLHATDFGILAAVDGNLKTSIDAGANWWPASDGMHVPNWTTLVTPNGESSLIIGGTEVGGLYFSDDNGGSWRIAPTELLYGYSVLDISAPSNDRIAVITDNLYLLTCNNGPSAWSVKNLPSTGAQIQAVSARNDGTILLGDGQGGVYRSHDWGDNWNFAGRIELPGSNVNIIAMRQDVFASNLPLYAATDRGLFRSDNDGNGWGEITPGGIRQAVVDLAVTPGASQPVRSVIAALENEVFRSTDRGASWESIIKTSAQEPVFDIFLTREGHVVCLAGETMYAWRMDTRSISTKPLPSETVAMTGKDLGGRYYAATRLRGLYRTRVDILGVGRNEAPAAGIRSMHVSPTPFGSAAGGGNSNPVLHYILERPSSVTVAAFDAAGRRLFMQDLGTHAQGPHQAAIDFGSAPAGMYTIVLMTDAGMSSCSTVRLQ